MHYSACFVVGTDNFAIWTERKAPFWIDQQALPLLIREECLLNLNTGLTDVG
jgi:hypothetical protein